MYVCKQRRLKERHLYKHVILNNYKKFEVLAFDLKLESDRSNQEPFLRL
jgi:hypothetical protein